MIPKKNSQSILSEEKKLEAEIKKAAKMGNKDACKILAKQLVQLRNQKTRTYAAGAKMSSIQSQAKEWISYIL